MADRLDIANIFVNFLRKARYERLIAEDELEEDQFYATTDGNEKTEYGDLFGNIEDQIDLYNALYSSRIFTKAMCDDPRGYAIVKALREQAKYFDINKFSIIGNPTITEEGIANDFTRTQDYVRISGLPNVISNSFRVKIAGVGVDRHEAGFHQSIISWYATDNYPSLQLVFNNYGANTAIQYGDETTGFYQYIWASPAVNAIGNHTYELFYNTTDGFKLFQDNNLIIENSTKCHLGFATLPIEVGTALGTHQHYWGGSVDLCSIEIDYDNIPVFRGYSEHVGTDTYPEYSISIPYYQSKDGVKIVDVQYKNLVDQLYNLTGQGNYIIIDEANEEFRLPLPDIYSQLENKSSFILRKWED